jgi:DNA-binding cell septation regulator SpoVG
MNKITISEISIYPIRPKDGLVAFSSCLFNGQLSLNSIAIYTKPDGNGYRLVFPAKMLPNGKQINLFYPINKDVAGLIHKAVIEAYEKLTEKVKKGDTNGIVNKP